MKNYIPNFIAEKYKTNNNKGKISAATMFIDISGFTKMTNDLISHGKEGAEVLSDIMNHIFDPAINAVYENNGFITVFAGDAFTAVFKENPLRALYSAFEILLILENNSNQNTKFGSFKLSIKIGLSFGQVEYGIIGLKDKLLTYYFKGEAIDNCAYAEHQCEVQEIIFDSKFYDYLNEKDQDIGKTLKFIQISDDYFKLLDLKTNDRRKIIPFDYKLENEIGRIFQPDELFDYNSPGEFRDVVNVFISFKYSDQLIIKILEGLLSYKGYLNGLDFGDKGANILLQFGVPLAYEKLRERAINFVIDLKDKLGEKFNDMKVGITHGTVYAGIIGNEKRCTYSCAGSCVNLSARLMIKADHGTVLVDKNVYHKVKNKYNFEALSNMIFKGFDENLTIYKLKNKTKNSVGTKNQQPLIGRDKEFDNLKELIKPIFNNKFADIVYVDGNAGIGKSRLINELRDVLKEEVSWLYLPCEEVLRKSFNPLTYFFKQYFEQSEDKNAIENKEVFERILDELISRVQDIDKKICKELVRTKSFLGHLINHQWKNSLYEQVEPKARYENTLDGIKNFVKAQTLLKPVIIELEDGHWIDSDTENFLQVLTKNVTDYPFIIISSCRLTDNGNNFNFKLQDVKTKRLNLQSLTQKGSEELIKSYLRDKNNTKVLLEIPIETFKIIYGKSEGNPFYIEQIMQYLSENNLLDKAYHLSKTKQLTIPSDIYGIVIARIDRLRKELKDVVKMASVLGREFAVKLLTQMLEEFKLKENIGKFLINGEHEKLWSQINELKYLFKHALIREAVYEMQLKNSLRKLHKLAAKSIKEIYNEDLKQYYTDLAYHYEKIEAEKGTIDYKETIYFLEKAGDQEKDNFRNKEALIIYSKLLKFDLEIDQELNIYFNKAEIFKLIGEYDSAIELLNKGIELCGESHNRQEAKLKNLLGDVLWRKSDYDGALVIYESAEELSELIKDKKVIATSLHNIGIVYYGKGNYDKAQEYYDKALAKREMIGDKYGIAASLHSIGVIYMSKGNYDKALEYFEKSLAIKKEIGDKNGMADSLNNMGINYYYKGYYDKALHYYGKSLTKREEIGDKSGASALLNNIGVLYRIKGNNDRALGFYKKTLAIKEEIGDKSGIAASLNNIGLNYYDIGKSDLALEYYEKSLTIEKEIGAKSAIAVSLINIGSIYHGKGNYDLALEYYEKALAINEEAGAKNGIATALNNIGIVYYDKRNYHRALEYFKRSLPLEEEIGAKEKFGRNYSYMACVYVKSGKYKDALNVALLHFKNIEEIEFDAEYGRTHLAVALVLSAKRHLLREEKKILDEISKFAKLEQYPLPYFEHAVSVSEEEDYLETLVPALYEYGKYLLSTSNEEEGFAKINLAKKKAKESGSLGELRKMMKNG